MKKVLNYIGIAIVIVSCFIILNSFLLGNGLAIIGVLCLLPDSISFQRSVKERRTSLSGYWNVKFLGLILGFIFLVVIFIIQIVNI